MAIPETLTAVLLTGYGDFDKLELRHAVSVPQPGPGDVLICVAAAVINSTDINTRIGRYARTQGETESWGARRSTSRSSRVSIFAAMSRPSVTTLMPSALASV